MRIVDSTLHPTHDTEPSHYVGQDNIALYFIIHDFHSKLRHVPEDDRIDTLTWSVFFIHQSCCSKRQGFDVTSQEGCYNLKLKVVLQCLSRVLCPLTGLSVPPQQPIKGGGSDQNHGRVASPALSRPSTASSNEYSTDNWDDSADSGGGSTKKGGGGRPKTATERAREKRRREMLMSGKGRRDGNAAGNGRSSSAPPHRLAAGGKNDRGSGGAGAGGGRRRMFSDNDEDSSSTEEETSSEEEVHELWIGEFATQLMNRMYHKQ